MIELQGKSILSLAEIYSQELDERDMQNYGRVLSDDEREEAYKLEASKEQEEKLEKERKAQVSRSVAEFMNWLPPRYKNSTFETFEGYPDVVKFLQEGKSAVLHGGNGTGKTHLGYACCRHFVEQGLTVKFVLAYRFFEAIKNSFDNGTTASVLNDFARYDYLVIDEIDKAYGSQLEFIHLYHLVNERYNFMRPTILITNASKSDLIKQIGSSTLDRIASEGAIIEMAGENYRQKQQK